MRTNIIYRQIYNRYILCINIDRYIQIIYLVKREEKQAIKHVSRFYPLQQFPLQIKCIM